MFPRSIYKELLRWKEKPARKPLILRGARQVGKTTVIRQLASEFDQFLYLNLELPQNRKPFESFEDLPTLLQSIFFLQKKSLQQKERTLLFIDEIQESPEALKILRYFYEEEPSIAVIAAGSMLETIFNPEISFPVGRVEYLIIHPVSFPEFLEALGEVQALEQLIKIPFPDFAFDKLLQLFRTYCITGGMPEIVQQYTLDNDLFSLNTIFDSLIISYLDDVEKYAGNTNQINFIRHAIRASFIEAGKRIKFQGFGNSAYGSREMGEALRTLEKALILHLIYPQTNSVLPLSPDKKKSPRLQVLDTGMLNYFAGIQRDIIGTEDLSAVYHGTMIEHLVGQELLASQYSALHGLNFWVREKNTSSAEVDFLQMHESKLIPIEVKSGAEGKLKSLHLFMDNAPHNMAVRFFGNKLSISQPVTPEGKEYFLLNLPYFLASQLNNYLLWFEEVIASGEYKKY
jgi:predicted AAA+ superfamily ATPase